MNHTHPERLFLHLRSWPRRRVSGRRFLPSCPDGTFANPISLTKGVFLQQASVGTGCTQRQRGSHVDYRRLFVSRLMFGEFTSISLGREFHFFDFYPIFPDTNLLRNNPVYPPRPPISRPPAVLLLHSLLLRKQVACWFNPECPDCP